jgi:hypothetical protein
MDATRQPQMQQITDKTMNPVAVNVLGLVLMIPITVLLAIPYWLAWKHIPFAGSNVIEILIALLPSIVIHELLHGVGYMLGGAKPDQVKFGFLVRSLMPYAHCKVPLRKWSYVIGVSLPGLILGVLPYLIGLLAHHPTLVAYGIFMILAAVGDLIILALLVTVPDHSYVQDHPTKPGFQVLSGDPQSALTP